MTDPTPESGRELDAKVAEEVFGYEIRAETNVYDEPKVRIIVGEDGAEWHAPISAYSTDIKFAWEVVEKLRDRDASVSVGAGPDSETGPVCGVTITRFGYREFQDRKWGAFAETAPLAICRAALRAVRADTEGADG